MVNHIKLTAGMQKENEVKSLFQIPRYTRTGNCSQHKAQGGAVILPFWQEGMGPEHDIEVYLCPMI